MPAIRAAPTITTTPPIAALIPTGTIPAIAIPTIVYSAPNIPDVLDHVEAVNCGARSIW
jgi:hypothetical protein